MQLKKNFKYVIIPRAGYCNYPKKNIPDNHIEMEVPLKFEVSSSELKKRIRSHSDTPHYGLQGLALRSVIDIIRREGLYITKPNV